VAEDVRPGSRAAVFAGGGVAGIAWMHGMVAGLRDGGIDLAAADQLSGTSAGSCVATVLATGAVDEAVARQRDPDSAEINAPFDFDRFFAEIDQARSEEPTEEAARVRIAALPGLGPHVSVAERRAVISARLPVQEWPAQRLLIAVVDAASGELVAFDRDSGVGLLDAVSASCALPGVWPPIEIGGNRYVDGGIRSLSNADLAAGHERVVIFVPTAQTEGSIAALESEIGRLESAQVHVIAADADSVAALGDNPLDPATRPPALAAGKAQAARELEALGVFWG
jgi:NTE family protein